MPVVPQDWVGLSGGMDLPGDDIPIVFIHGLGGASTLDYVQVAAMPNLAGHRRLLIDLPGSGTARQDAPISLSYSIEDHATGLKRYLDAMGLGKIVLFGHSMGGAIALSLAALNPGRITGIVLSEANLDAGGGMWSRAIAEQDESVFVERGFGILLAEAHTDDNPWVTTLALSSPVALHREAVSLIVGVTPSWRDILYGLSCPRTFIFGSQTLPDADAEELPRHGVSVVTVANAGHNMAWENPEGLADAIAEHLSRAS